MLLIPVAVLLEEAAALLRQDHRLIPVPRQPHGFDQAGFAQVPEVARTRIRRPIIVVAEVSTGDHSKSTDGREGP